METIDLTQTKADETQSHQTQPEPETKNNNNVMFVPLQRTIATTNYI